MTITETPLPTVEEPTKTKTLINLGPLAAALIREQGWWDGSTEDAEREMGFCVYLALDEIAKNVGGDDDFERQLAEALGIPVKVEPVGFCSGMFYDFNMSDIFAWNDSHTAEEVIDFLDNAKIMVEV